MSKSTGKAKTIELEWDGSKYVAELTDTNNVLSKFTFSASATGFNFSVSGNKLTITTDNAPTGDVTITASRSVARCGVLVWTDNKYGPDGGIQDTVTYTASVSDPVKAFIKLKVSYGSAKIIKTSEDGKVDGIKFTVVGDGVNQTVTTNSKGEIQIDNLMPGTYTVTEQTYDKYVPQETHRVTVLAGQTATVSFNNVLRLGDLTVTKTSEDGLVEGVKFHLYGTSVSGLAVDEFAVTNSKGVATFKDEYVSKLLGKETIDTNTYGRSRGRNGNYSTNYQLAGRELMTPDEVRMLDNQYALLFIRGERPIQDFKYDILHHPNVSQTTDGGAPAYKHGEDTRSIASMTFEFDPLIVKQAQKINAEKHDFVLLSEEELEELIDEKEKKEHEKP